MNELDLQITAIRHETADTVTITIKRSNDEPILYQAGQFITLILFIDGVELRRSYSFSSTPGIDAEPSITIRRIANGAASRWFTEKARVGDRLTALEPAGRFQFEPKDGLKKQLWLIAAGSGIVPVFSLLKKMLRDEEAEMILLYQNRHEHNIIFKQELEDLQKKYPSRFRYILLLSVPHHKTRPHRLTNNTLDIFLKKYLDKEKQTLFFLCGPAAFMRMAHFTLRVAGVADPDIRKENFTVDYVPSAPAIEDASPKKVVLKLKEEQYQFTVVYPKNILQAALDHGVPMPYSCRGGRCSSCITICKKGSVKMSINEVLTETDLAAGMVLTCVGYAASDLELQG